jgi:hypothetical protein
MKKKRHYWFSIDVKYWRIILWVFYEKSTKIGLFALNAKENQKSY